MRPSSFVALLTLLSCTTAPAAPPPARPAHWAQPVAAHGPDNWYRVSPDLYRCEQPSPAEMRALAAFGIRSVVNLRQLHSDADEVDGTPLALREVPMAAGSLRYDQLVSAVRALLQAEKPVVVHCWQGADRTGAVVAAWRVAVDGWTPQQALEEMVAGGYGHSFLYGNLRRLVAGLDRAQLRRDLGLPDA